MTETRYVYDNFQDTDFFIWDVFHLYTLYYVLLSKVKLDQTTDSISGSIYIKHATT
jgi:hypothetical protein